MKFFYIGRIHGWALIRHGDGVYPSYHRSVISFLIQLFLCAGLSIFCYFNGYRLIDNNPPLYVFAVIFVLLYLLASLLIRYIISPLIGSTKTQYFERIESAGVIGLRGGRPTLKGMNGSGFRLRCYVCFEGDSALYTIQYSLFKKLTGCQQKIPNIPSKFEVKSDRQYHYTKITGMFGLVLLKLQTQEE